MVSALHAAPRRMRLRRRVRMPSRTRRWRSSPSTVRTLRAARPSTHTHGHGPTPGRTRRRHPPALTVLTPYAAPPRTRLQRRPHTPSGTQRWRSPAVPVPTLRAAPRQRRRRRVPPSTYAAQDPPTVILRDHGPDARNVLFLWAHMATAPRRAGPDAGAPQCRWSQHPTPRHRAGASRSRRSAPRTPAGTHGRGPTPSRTR